MAMGAVYLSNGPDCHTDDIIVVDPMNEYFDIAKLYGGTVVNLSSYTDNYMNPLEVDLADLSVLKRRAVIRQKSEFMLGLCEQSTGESLNSRQKTLIDRCVRKVYQEAARKKQIPVMTDFYRTLLEQKEEEARGLALSMELFTEGSLNIFNHQSNVDVDNRFLVFGIQDLGEELFPIAMLVMLECIQQRIMENWKKGIATWLWIDEFHVLLQSPYSANYLWALWKKVRKRRGICTGITQNLADILRSDSRDTIGTMLANSEFVALLRQSSTDLDTVADALNISEAQLDYVNNAPAGTGLLRFGSVVIPFDETVSKDSKLYHMYNTNPYELAEQAESADGGGSTGYPAED